MTEEESDNYSVDSLEIEDMDISSSYTNVTFANNRSRLNDVEDFNDRKDEMLLKSVCENPELHSLTNFAETNDGELQAKITQIRRKNISNIPVPFYSGDVSVSDVHEMQRLHKRLVNTVVAQKVDSLPQHRSKFTYRATSMLPFSQTTIIHMDAEPMSNYIATSMKTNLGELNLRNSPKMSNFRNKCHTSKGTKINYNTTSSCSFESYSIPRVSSNHTDRTKVICPSSWAEKKKKGTSYLEEYRLQKEAKNVKKIGSERTESMELNDSKCTRSVCEEHSKLCTMHTHCSEEESRFYQNIINGELDLNDLSLKLNHNERTSEAACVENLLSSVSTILPIEENLGRVPQIRNEFGSRSDFGNLAQKRNYVPYKYRDYRLPILPSKLGMLGPDLVANKDKMERLQKQREYGAMASTRNLEMIRLKNMKKQLSDDASQSTEPISVPLWHNIIAKKNMASSSHSSVKPTIKVPVCCITSPKPVERPELSEKQKQKKSRGLKITAPKEKLQSNQEVIKKMQERHRKEVCVVESIRRNCRNE